MQGRTFVRIMLEKLFVDNICCKVIKSIVKFCNEQTYYTNKELKYSEFVPLKHVVTQNKYKNKFVFNATIPNEVISK